MDALETGRPSEGVEPGCGEAATPEQAGQAPTEERLTALDLIRGVAILGILPANIPTFREPVPASGIRTPSGSWMDQAVDALTVFFVQGKMITLLAILFGVGLAIQFDRARAAGRPFDRYYVRRSLLLLLIGLVHALFLWYGDILTSYAIVALGALVLVRTGQRGALWTAGVTFTWSYGWMLLITVLLLLFMPALQKQMAARTPPPPVAAAAERERPRPVDLSLPSVLDGTYFSERNQVATFRYGTFGQMTAMRAVFFSNQVCAFWALVGWYLLGCFMVGTYLLRRGLFQDPNAQKRLFPRFFMLAGCVGLPLHIAAVVDLLVNKQSFLYILLNYMGALPMALGYLALLLIWARSGRAERLQSRLRAVGRMALTNYLSQTVICVLIFYGTGLGLYDRVSAAAASGIVLGIWLLQLAWSPWWLQRFEMGPVEWLWRSLSDGRRRPLARTQQAAPPAPSPAG